MFAAIFGGFYFYLVKTNNVQSASKPDSFLATISAPTPTPHISVNYQAGTNSVFKDDFSDNRNDWINDEQPANLVVKDGRLSFGSSDQDTYATSISAVAAYLDQPYYLQADLAVDKQTAEGYGIIFEVHYGNNEFFLFQINPESKQYYLYHHLNDSWSLRMAGITESIQSYPAVNTLGIYVNKDYLEFYINHKIVGTYQDSGTSFESGEGGFFVDNSGFQLMVTDFFVLKAGGQ